jgi:hypothetical protein
MTNPSPVISLLTDFGEDDGFVGTMKGVMKGIAPQATFIDISHRINPQDVHQAAFVLMTSVPFFPAGTVHLVVVDPGVGSTRRPIAVQTDEYQFIAPDNGVLSYVVSAKQPYKAIELSNPDYRLPYVSQTFHGRDIFAPAAAHLAAGVAIDQLGPPIEQIMRLDPPALSVHQNEIRGEILNIDHFGNLRTSIHSLRWEEQGFLCLRPLWGEASGAGEELQFSARSAEIFVGELRIKGVSETFSSVEVGEVVAFVGSERALEIAINQGNLAHVSGVQKGDPVRVRFIPR